MAMKNLDRWKARADRIIREIERKKKEEERDKEELSKTVTIAKCLKSKGKEVKVFNREESKSVIDDVKNSHIDWEEEEGDFKQEEIVKTSIWKEIDGEKWIDDGVEEIK